MAKPESEKKVGKNALYGVILFELCIIILLGILLMRKSTEVKQLTDVINSKDSDISIVTNQLESLSADFERIREEREKLGLDNQALTSEMEEINDQIASLKTKSRLDAKDKKSLQALINRLKEEISQKDNEISKLKLANDSLKTNVSMLQETTNKLGDSIQNLSTHRDHLEGQLAYAAILKAENIAVAALKPNGKEYENESYKANKISQLKLYFTLADNKAATKGYKNFKMRLITPSGKTFSDPNNGGGTLTTSNGNEIRFTMTQKSLFQNHNEMISMILPKGFNFKKGEYIIEIYCEGYLIGETEFLVK